MMTTTIKRMMMILPFFFHVRLGGGIPLDSQSKVTRPPTVTVRGETSSDPRILGGTERVKQRDDVNTTVPIFNLNVPWFGPAWHREICSRGCVQR